MHNALSYLEECIMGDFEIADSVWIKVSSLVQLNSLRSESVGLKG